MRVGTVKEIKNNEYRVGLTPACAKTYVKHGHEVWVQTDAGTATGFPDSDYAAAGAKIVGSREEVFGGCDMVVKVKEPLPEEYDLLRPRQILYTFLHLAADETLTHAMLRRKIRGVAYETIELADRSLPCLKPMSEIAGRLSVQQGAKYLEKTFGGRGVLLGGVPGVPRGKVAIIGGGVVGLNACKIAVGMGADVTVLDVSPDRLAYLDDIFSTHITTLYSNESNIERVAAESDVLIGGVLLPGAKAPKLIRREHLKIMRPGSVIVDVAVDQGGCCETTRPTTHQDPIFVVDDVVHYCVANMPGAVARSSTVALTSVTTPYGVMIADHGLEEACDISLALRRGVNVYEGVCVYDKVAETFSLPCSDLDEVMKS